MFEAADDMIIPPLNWMNFDVTVDGNILIQNIFCIQHTTIDLKIKDMVKWKTEQNGCRIDVNSNIVEF
jgi:hypothetical protein